MSSDLSSPHARPRSPTPLSLWRTKPSSTKATNGNGDNSRADGSENASGIVAGEFEPGEVEEIGEISEVMVADKKSQDERPPHTTTSEVRVKTEETPVTIPSPTRSVFLGGRKRGSRSTIDVFGEPTIPVSPERRNSVTLIPKEEEIAMDFSNNGVIDVDAFLATLSPSKPKPRLVSSPPPMSLEPSTSTNQTPHSTTNIASTSAVPPSDSIPTPSLQLSPYPPDILDKCRHILVPLVERNAKLRKPSMNEELVKSRAFKLLSDKLCTDFIKLAKQVHEQISLHPPRPRRTPSVDDVSGQKRGREEAHDSPEHPRKVAKRESPKEMVLDDVDSATSPGSLVAVTPTEDIQMNEDIENIAPEHLSEPLVPGASTGVDVTHPPTSREASAAPPGPGSDANRQHLGITTPEREASAETDIPMPLQENVPASSPDHVDHDILSAHATVAACEEKDEALSSNSSPAHTPSNTAPVPVARSASRPPSRSTSPHANEASVTDAVAELGTSSHESEVDHAVSDIDAELSVDRILDPTSEDEPVAHTPVPPMSPKQIVITPDPPVVHPPCLVPGVWQTVVGQSSPRVEEIEFYVDDATADAIERWSRRRDTFSPNERHVAVHLLCVSHTTSDPILQDMSLSPEAIAHELFVSKPDWPVPGELVVTLNCNPDTYEPDSELPPQGRSWMVQTPMQWPERLDITSHVRRGQNRLNLVQLVRLSDRLFVIHAAEPSEKEKADAYRQISAWKTIKKRWSPHSSPRNLAAKTSPKSPPALTTSGENTPPGTPPEVVCA